MKSTTWAYWDEALNKRATLPGLSAPLDTFPEVLDFVAFILPVKMGPRSDARKEFQSAYA